MRGQLLNYYNFRFYRKWLIGPEIGHHKSLSQLLKISPNLRWPSLCGTGCRLVDISYKNRCLWSHSCNLRFFLIISDINNVVKVRTLVNYCVGQMGFGASPLLNIHGKYANLYLCLSSTRELRIWNWRIQDFGSRDQMVQSRRSDFKMLMSMMTASLCLISSFLGSKHRF